MSEAIHIGDVVTVVGCDDTSFHNAQGVVMEITDEHDPEGGIKVNFGPNFSWIFGARYNSKRTTGFRPEELRKDVCLTPENLTYRLFGRSMWHSMKIYKDDHTFSPDNNCECEGCSQKASSRCLVNCGGVVYELDLCEQHTERCHGKSMDWLPDGEA